MDRYSYFTRKIFFDSNFPYIKQIIITACDNLPDIVIKLSTPENIDMSFTLPANIHIVDGTLADIFSINMKNLGGVMTDVIVEKTVEVANGIKNLYSTLYGINKDDIKIVSISTPVVEVEHKEESHETISLVSNNRSERDKVLPEGGSQRKDS